MNLLEEYQYPIIGGQLEQSSPFVSLQLVFGRCSYCFYSSRLVVMLVSISNVQDILIKLVKNN